MLNFNSHIGYNKKRRKEYMATIIKTSTKDQVYDIIKEKIFLQEYDLGDTINITALSSELGVSNTPIREALSKLEAEGLVTSSMSSKVRVIDLNEKLFNETSHCFFVLTFGAYSLCAVQDRSSHLQKLMKQALDEQQKALQSADYSDFVSKAIAFDRTFVAATGNEKMISIYDSLSPLLYLLTRYNHQQEVNNRDINLEQHREIAQAVADGDSVKVQKLLYFHFDKHL